ncbi:MAG TPA: NnrS family protein, partial [Verrucomicrobiae bacterium]|nr:NnrS family protein [Verrucomicrobiae bacterium]
MNRRIKLDDIGREPFRVFFPAGVLSGILGVALWPLYFTGCVRLYPGPAHAHIMAFGLFGAFILGFLGTALPRLLSAQPLGIGKVALLLALHLAMVASYAAQSFIWGDSIFLILLAL